ncbi:MAG: hypothetical protein OEM59_03065 [Rhodospirillales bacterium]|nr:hypothetical protein [Rhodospirillales bacterium]
MPGRLLAAIGRHAPPCLAAGVFLGLVLPDLAALLRPALGPLVALLLAGSLLRLDWQMLAATLRRPGSLALATGWQLMVSPALAWALTFFAGLPPGLTQALILNAAAPSLVASVTLAQLTGLDAPLAATLVVVTTLFLPLTLTPVMFWLLGLDLAVDLAAFYTRFGLFVALPFALAGALRFVLPGALFARHAMTIDGFNVVVLVLAALAMMDGVTARLLSAPGSVALFLAAATLFNACFQVLGALLFRAQGRHLALSMGLVSGNRNTALILVLAGGIAHTDLALYVAMAQIPIYLLPLVAKPIYSRLV